MTLQVLATPPLLAMLQALSILTVGSGFVAYRSTSLIVYSFFKDPPQGDHSSIPGAASGTERARVFSSDYTDHGLHIVGRGVKKLIKGIQGLRKLGVEGLVDPLPKIAVVGDQSTGKSSLIEGIRYIIHNQGLPYRLLSSMVVVSKCRGKLAVVLGYVKI